MVPHTNCQRTCAVICPAQLRERRRIIRAGSRLARGAVMIPESPAERPEFPPAAKECVPPRIFGFPSVKSGGGAGIPSNTLAIPSFSIEGSSSRSLTAHQRLPFWNRSAKPINSGINALLTVQNSSDSNEHGRNPRGGPGLADTGHIRLRPQRANGSTGKIASERIMASPSRLHSAPRRGDCRPSDPAEGAGGELPLRTRHR
jgi:hypothetical protein